MDVHASVELTDVLRGIIEGSSDFIAAVDMDCRYLVFNHAYGEEFQKIFGKRIAVGDSLLEAMAHLPVDQAKAAALWERVREGERLTVVEDFGSLGRERNHYEIRFHPIHDRRHRLVGIAHVVHNVTRHRRSELSRRRSEARFRRLVNANLIGILITRYDGSIIEANDAFLATVGYSREDLRSGRLRWDQLTPPQYRAFDQQMVRQLRATGTCTPWEKCYTHRDGHLVPVLLGVAVLDEPSADCICFVLDLTGRKQTEEALQQSQERYRQLLAAVTTYTYQVQLRNGEPVVTEHSLGCLTATGYSPADYQADPLLWIRMVPPEDRALVTGHVQALLAGQPVPPIEHRILHRDGSVRWIRSTLVPHHAESGSLVRYDGLVEDITERKRIEDRFRLLLESMPDAMLVAGRDGKILLVNEQAEQMFGYRREELIGRSVEMLVPPSLRESHAEQRAGYSKSPHTRLMGHGPEVRAMRKDGSEFPAEISLRPLVTEQGMQVFSAIRDITERKQAERALRENAAQLLAAQRIQEHLLPTEPPAIAGLDIAGALYAAEFAAGDYFDYLPMPDGALGVVIGDVAGHGFGPALVMASTHAHLQSLSQLHGEVSPILAQVNSILLREIEEDRYVTLLLARLDPRSRSFTFANAGHPAGYVLDAAGQLKARLESGSLPLGISSDTQFHAHGPVALEPGDLLLLLTDGILEASAADGAQFGVGRTLDVVRRNLARPAAEIIRAIYDAVLEFSAGHKIVDDLTTVIVKVDSSSIP